MLAASRDMTESVQLLLDAGANTDLQNQVLRYNCIECGHMFFFSSTAEMLLIYSEFRNFPQICPSLFVQLISIIILHTFSMGVKTRAQLTWRANSSSFSCAVAFSAFISTLETHFVHNTNLGVMTHLSSMFSLTFATMICPNVL